MSVSEVVAGAPELFPSASFASPLPTPAPALAPAAQIDPQSSEPTRGQLLLGTDKRNPVLTIYEDERGERLLVYYGFELFETVNNVRKDPAFKLMLGRLYNAGLNLKVLSQTFGADTKTIRRWGQVLLQGDPIELIRVLEGRSRGRKRTLVVENFARLRWPDLVAEGNYGAVGRLLEEIQSVFDVTISRSAMSDLIRELKSGAVPARALETAAAESGPVSGLETPMAAPESAASTAEAEPQGRETSVKCVPAEVEETIPKALEKSGLPGVEPTGPPGHTSHPSPFFPRDPTDALYWCDHAGVLIFARPLAAVANVSGTSQTILAQWLSALWLGAQNIEQTKFLNWEDLELILGGVVRFPTPQRDQLKGLAADTGLVDALWRFNQENLGEAVGTDFYFDPHTKHYTGEQNVLKGWCPRIRGADKVLHSDFIHTAQGAPIYFETTDNFSDLRQRFGRVIARARQALQWPAERVPTYVVDRGIYGQALFQSVIENPSFHLITWQKGFVAQAWDPQKVMGKTTLTRVRNSSTDVRTCHFEYVDQRWEQNAQLRQIVVQATNDQGRKIQVAILTDDLTRPAVEIIHLMFQRWLQENDFKYLDKHFGINQITSYRSLDYETLKGQVEDREVKSGARKALDLSLKQATEQLKRHLLAEEQALQAHQRRGVKRQELERQVAQGASADAPENQTLKRQLETIKTADGRYDTTRLERRKGIEKSHQRIVGIQMQRDATQAKESRLEALIEAQMVKLDGQCKRLMDVLRITARNLFYQALQPFKQAYDNYRDDHGHFRQLTQAPGVLEVSGQEILIHLLPRTRYGGELKKAVNQTLAQINAQGLKHPCLPGRTLKFRLGQRSEMELKMNVDA